jgi:hypothetical protein
VLADHQTPLKPHQCPDCLDDVRDCGCCPTLPTVTVTPVGPGSSVCLVQAPGLPFGMAHRAANGWKPSPTGATVDSLFALVDDYMAAHGCDEYQLDARAVRGVAP